MPAGGINPNFPQFHSNDKTVERGLNGMARTVEMLAAAQRPDGANILMNGAGIFPIPVEDETGIPFQNVGATLGPYQISTWNSISTAFTKPAAQVAQPSQYGCQQNFIINGPATVAGSAFGYGQPGPYYIIQYDSADGAPLPNERWGPRPSTYLLKKYTGGFRALGVWDSENHYGAFVADPMFEFYGVNNGSQIAFLASGTINVLAGADGSESDTGIQIGVRARFGAIAAGAKVQCFMGTAGYNWYALATNTCPS